MTYDISISYDEDFCNLLHTLHENYPEQLFEIDGIGSQLDIHQSSKQFFKRDNAPAADKSIDANANVSGKDVITYNYEVPKPLMKLNSYYNLWSMLKKIYGLDRANEVIEAQVSGDIYINDAYDIGRPYCFNYSTYDIALEGLKMGSRLTIDPPKGLSSFLRQLEQFTVYAANSTLGATGLADTLIVSAWFIDRILETGYDHRYLVTREDPHTGDKELLLKNVRNYAYEHFTSLIYTFNWEFRGNQSPFTNLSIYDDNFLKELVPSYVIDGVAPNIDTVKMAQVIFLDAYNDTLSRTPITFPVLTACFSTSLVDGVPAINDKQFVKQMAEANSKYGIINFYNGETSTLSSCCRLRSKTDKLGYTNTFGAGSTKIGSVGVVTMNLYRYGNISSTVDELVDKVKYYTEMCADINHAKRMFIKDRIDRGSLPLYSLGLMSLTQQYSTAGITGLYEAIDQVGYDITTNEGKRVADAIMDAINVVNESCDEKCSNDTEKYRHNFEQVPAETSSIKLAKKDVLLGYQTGEYPYYSNQFIPLISGADMLERIHLQGLFDSKCTGGAICHINICEPIDEPGVMESLIEYCAQEGVVYWASNYALGWCPNGHGMDVVKHKGETEHRCAVCGSELSIYTRVVGFLTNTKHWNSVRRKHDWPNRTFYKA